eukprot:GCRY01002589.1.p1 GENE.GCRY01002589.1~~GCRY01002589.1.p1  ORF type:complete len:211 (+),score=14.02 GCRY01002589.1:192-824(+)
MEFEEIDNVLKIIVVGNGGVGKTSLIKRLCQNSFSEEYKKTIGVDFLEMLFSVNHRDFTLMFWDTAGQEDFDSITRTYYRGANAAIIAFSATDFDSCVSVKKWHSKILNECGEIPIVLMENKIDSIHICITQMQSNELSESLGLKLFRTSVKQGINLTEMVEELLQLFLKEENLTENKDDGGHLKEGTFHIIEPSRRRTKGKKRNLCSVV